ncbi:hypothetical protein V8E53_006766 [Lactarius tabidus]
MPSVAATLRQYPSHPAATTLKQTAYGSSLRPILSTEHIIIPRLSTPAHQRAPVSASFLPLHYESEAMQTPVQIRRHCMTVLSGRHGSSHIPVLHGGNTSISSSSTPRPALPRKIASGVFFVDPTCGTNDAPPSTRTLLDLEITHAVVARGSDLRLSSGMKALFVGPHDPLSRIVSWMRAVRRLGACIIVSDIAAAAGYLVVELGLSPRSAWLRIARGLPPPGDLVLARLCALALAHSAKDEQVSRPDRVEGAVSQSKSGSDPGWRVAPRSCGSMRGGTRGESSLKHVLVSSL